MLGEDIALCIAGKQSVYIAIISNSNFLENVMNLNAAK